MFCCLYVLSLCQLGAIPGIDILKIGVRRGSRVSAQSGWRVIKY
jgi:hypothetical protein